MARGTGIVLMFGYHFSWDLTYFGFAELPLFTDPWWLAFRSAIVSTFLMVAGFCHALTRQHGFRPRRFFGRLALIAAAAGAVTVATFWAFPEGYVFFGILHNLAVAAVLVLAFSWLPVPAIAAAAAFLATPSVFAHPLFDHPWLGWVGLATEDVFSVDYVPIFPWFGVVLLGVAAGRLIVRSGPVLRTLAGWRADAWPSAALHWLGRHSLVLYLVHQPVFCGLLYGARYLLR